MSAVAVVLAGGKGTRSADPSKAKIAQEIAGASLLQWHLHSLASCEITRVVIVAGYLGDQVERLTEVIEAGSRHITVVHEEEQRGTVAALLLAAEATNAAEFLVVLGDILMAVPIQRFLDGWRASGKAVGVVVHPSTHPKDSDAVFPTHDHRVLALPKSQVRDHLPNMSSAGLFAITRQGLYRYRSHRDFGSDVLPEAAKNSDLFAFISSHYLKDTGTPERLAAAQQDVARGAFERRGQFGPRPAIFLDRDGVINPVSPEYYSPDDYQLLPGVAQAIRIVNQSGTPVFVVTNQPAIAKGFMTHDDQQLVRAKMDQLLWAHGAFVDDYVYCPHHPQSGFDGEIRNLKVECSCRKPSSGMLLALAERHGIDLGRSVMVGDTQRDEGAAKGAGVRFIHVDDCAGEGSSEAILRALEVTSC